MRARLLAFVFAALALPSIAHAGDRPRVAILEIIIEGDAPPELRNQMDRSLAGGLYAAGYEVIPRDEVVAKLKGAPELVGCLTTTCLSRVADLVGVRQFVRVRVTANGAAYTFEVELLSADEAAGPLERVERTCEVCTIDEANEMMSTAAAALGQKDDEPVADKLPVRVLSRPPGAQIEIDGERVTDVTPYDTELTAGKHTVRVILPGRAPSEAEVVVVAQPAGGPQVVELSLGPVVDAGGHRKTKTKYANWKWAATGAAVVTVVAGIWLISVDGEGLDCPMGPPGTECENEYDTATGGTVLTLTGIAVGGLAGYLFYKDRPKRESRTKVGASVGPGAGSVTLGWSF